MILSRASECGLQAMVELCRFSDGEFVPVSALARRRGLSPSFLSKVLNQLVEHGLVESHRGPGGGVRLARPAHRVRLLEVAEAIDGPDFLSGCLMGLPECSEKAPCPLHARWNSVREPIRNVLSARNLSELAGESGIPQARRRRKLPVHARTTRGGRRR